jgi:Niemann-Pick C1 protein
MVTELDYLVSDEYGTGFYDSCKEVKFGPLNQRAMELIGGGAKNYTGFLKFLGDKKFLGSPFQMNFPRPAEGVFPGLGAMDEKTRRCDDADKAYRCACVDCPGSCVELPDVAEARSCRVGVLPCFSFAVIAIYSVLLLLLIVAVSGHVAYQKHAKLKNERLRLLQDAAPSDDEDEDADFNHIGAPERPKREYWLNTMCDKAFNKLGTACAEFPAITISTTLIIVVLLSLGWINFSVERDPVRLWVAPDSAAAREKAFFDDNFGPFYRPEQVFVVNEDGPVLTYDNLKWWFDVEKRVSKLRTPEGVGLKDICFKPVGAACVVQSVTGYFQGDFGNVDKDSWQDTLSDCANQPADVNCLPTFQQPLNPKMILGNYTGQPLESKSIVVTWVVNNHPEGTLEVQKAMDFEQLLKQTFLDVQQEARARGLRMSFSTDISLEEELNKSTNTDAKIVAISYLVMFLYASMALGSSSFHPRTFFRNPAAAVVQSKFMVGVAGIAIVLMSVSAAVGLFSALGVKVTLIIAEVIPFLILAVGVDNVFLIVHEFERINAAHGAGAPVPARMGRAMGRVGPSILLSAATETVAFSLGAAVGMPAVRNFAVYAAGAVLVNAVLQVTMFVAVLALNQRRVEAGRADCIPCLRAVAPDDQPAYQHDGDEGWLQTFIRRVYAPRLLHNKTKVAVVTVFLGIWAASLALIPSVQLGLDQRIALPSDSYLIPYFDDLDAYFGVGPPVYFVARGVNATARAGQTALCGRFLPCDDFSLSNVLEQERKRPEVSYVADATASWVDDFLLWLNPVFDECCVVRGKPCFEGREPPYRQDLVGMPEGEEFLALLTKWLKAPITDGCPLAGKAAYQHAVVLDANRTTITASHFRTSHTPLRSQDDFIRAYAAARRIAEDVSRRQGVDVFPYSPFYIFFDQYASIARLAATLLGAGLAAVLGLTALMLGSARTALVVTATVGMIVSGVLGSMAVAGVSLNAVSLVNLVICLGIALEFCAHVARAFAFPAASVLERAPWRFQPGGGAASSVGPATPGDGDAGGLLPRDGRRGDEAPAARDRDLRAWGALAAVGGSVFMGITVTKLLGVAVLAFTRSRIFEVYYFRVWVALVVFAAAHALVFLPVALSLFGGRGMSPFLWHLLDTDEAVGYVDPESEGGLERDLRSRRYLLADDEYDSDDY